MSELKTILVRGTAQQHVSVRAADGRQSLTLMSYVVVIIACVVTIGPFLYLIPTSLKSSGSLFSYPPEWITLHPYWRNYTHLLFDSGFLRWLANTIFVAGAVTAAKVFMDSMAGYAFAKLRFHGKRPLFGLILMTIMVPFAAIFIPLFFLVRDLGMLDTYWALILPPLANPIGIFLMRGFIQGLPNDLENAARLDGSSELRIYWEVILPLVKPGLVVLAVLTFLVQYTSFLWPLVAIQSDSLKVVTVGLASQRGIQVVDYGLLSAGSLMALIPIVLFFIVLQRFFIAGSLAGALKQ